jgi:hypothetical protein
MKTATSKKTSKSKRTAKGIQTESTDPDASPRGSYRYEPYPKAKPTPEPERGLPADRDYLETLGAAAKALYRGDRELLEYIVALEDRTAAILEHVNRTETQLRSAQGALERIQSYVRRWEEIGGFQQPFGDGDSRMKLDGDKVTLAPDESDEEDVR